MRLRPAYGAVGVGLRGFMARRLVMDAITVGETAGKVWQHLAKSGPTPAKNIPREIGSDPLLAQMALGWLSRESKIKFEEKGKTLLISLTETEMMTRGS